MPIFQLIGLVLPVIFILWIYGDLIRECNKGNGSATVHTWMVVMTMISIFVLGFTLGTLI